MTTLADLSRRLADGTLTARALVEQYLERIADPASEGARAFISVAAESAREQADRVDQQRRAGMRMPPFAGIPLAIKDLFDVAGEITGAGSRILADRPPAQQDAAAIARLRAAGFIFVGRTNMTEFAYSGLGLNPHYGTPLCTFDRAARRIPGGSTSGGAVAVADGMAAASLGTDTGGSCRIPAAFNGVVGFKPTASRVPRDGVVPLSHTLDSVGPLAASVACCAALDEILSGQEQRDEPPASVRGLRILLPTTLVLDDMEAAVARAFERCVEHLARAGATIAQQPLVHLQRIPQINARGGLAAAEAYQWHREMLEQYSDRYDPRVAARILKGREATAADIRELHDQRAAMIDVIDRATRDWDMLAMPTVPIIAPLLSALESDADYTRLNVLVLRNPSLVNFLDRCAISLPIHDHAEAPVGLMLVGTRNGDSRLLRIAHAIEHALPQLSRTRP